MKETQVNYTQEKLWQAVETLVTGRGRIQERLAYAAEFLIRLDGGHPAFPEHADLQKRLDRVVDRLTNVPATGD